MRIVIAGGRNFKNASLLATTMDALLRGIESVAIVSGGARGADSLGEWYAGNRNIPVTVFKANWDKYGKSAGYRRNEEMARNADALVAFWDGKSKGTKHMIDLAKKAGLTTTIISY